MNKETLEEAIGNYIYSNYDNQPLWEIIENAVKFGAKWQQERSYSEEDMLLAFQTGRNFQLTGENNFKELIEQLKK